MTMTELVQPEVGKMVKGADGQRYWVNQSVLEPLDLFPPFHLDLPQYDVASLMHLSLLGAIIAKPTSGAILGSVT